MKSDEEFKEELSRINSDIEVLGKYQGNKKAILCRCMLCGHEWKAAPNNLLSKQHKCPKCSHEKRGIARRKTNSDFISELSRINPSIFPLEEYVTGQKSISCKCMICGHVWKATPNNLLDKGSRCPDCSHASTSVIEQILFESFTVALGAGKVISRDRKAIGKELDILITDYNVAVEFGAWYWHKNRLEKDEEKKRLCSEHGIALYTIYEDCPDEYKEKSDRYTHYYTENVSNERNYHTVKEIVMFLAAEIGISFDIIESQWGGIIRNSIEKARRRSDQDFAKIVRKSNPTVELLGPFIRHNERIECRCKICGHEWTAIPSSLIDGHACPKCARRITGEKKTITNTVFLERLSEINPEVEPLEEYMKGDVPIRCKCKECGNVWSTKPKNLLIGHGCPACGKQRRIEKEARPVRCVETGICYESISDAHRKTGIYNIHKCANETQRTAGGYHWEYVE